MPTTCAVLAPDDRRVVHELLADVGAGATVGQRLRLLTARLHAARRRGQVIEQALADFCAANTMLGFLFARPCEKPHEP